MIGIGLNTYPVSVYPVLKSCIHLEKNTVNVFWQLIVVTALCFGTGAAPSVLCSGCYCCSAVVCWLCMCVCIRGWKLRSSSNWFVLGYAWMIPCASLPSRMAFMAKFSLKNTLWWNFHSKTPFSLLPKGFKVFQNLLTPWWICWICCKTG